jgi:signal transduction histidine kinase
MNFSLAQDLSLYQLALGVENSLQELSLTHVTILSMLKSQIDLLIEQQISATFWVKLPPGKIWQSELLRYKSSGSVCNTIYNCQIRETRSDSLTQVQLLPSSKLQQEYFLIVLSANFCSLIVARRPIKSDRISRRLLTINTFDPGIIQPVLDGIKQVVVPGKSAVEDADFICPSGSALGPIEKLFNKQLQRQDEFNCQITQQRNQKLYSEDEYLSSLCQELRIPLTHMKTALSLLNSPHLKPAQRQRYLQMLNTECDRQNYLIIGLLDLAQLEQNLEETKLEPVRLRDIVPGLVSTYQPVAQEKGIMLAYTIPADLPPVWCVSGGLKQIVINLLHNSIKFTPKGGEVWVTASLHGHGILLEFRDTGIGISESDLPKIFDCFYRVRSGLTDDLASAGLGLTIVQRLLWYSGGSISVKSKLDQGSIFTVQLMSVRDP